MKKQFCTTILSALFLSVVLTSLHPLQAYKNDFLGLSKKQINEIPDGLHYRVRTMPPRKKKRLMANVKRKKKSVFVAYLLSIFGLHVFYIEDSYSGVATTLSQIAVVYFAWNFIKSFGKTALTATQKKVVIGGLICMTLSWLADWMFLYSQVKKHNKNIFRKELNAMRY